MPKFLSKLVKKVPPFRYIHAKLEELEKDYNQLDLTLQDTIYKLQQAESENIKISEGFTKGNNALKQELNKANDEIQKLLTEQDKYKKAQNDFTKKLEDIQNDFTKKLRNISDNQEKAKNQIATEKDQLIALQRESKNLNNKIDTTRNRLSKDIEYYYYKGLHPDQYAENLKAWFYQRTGRKLDLDHPKTFDEKIQWLKLYDSTPLKRKLSDKLAVRDWIEEKIGAQYLIPLLGVYDHFDDIDFDKLPDRFVIKTNHACMTNRIVTDKNTFNRSEAKWFFDTWMKRDFAYWNGLELQYKGIEPKILVEEYIENEGHEINEYKIFCFDGIPYYVMFQTNRSSGIKKAFYDRNWNHMPFIDNHERLEIDVEKPDNLDEMLLIAENLSQGFYHVRVDLYRLDSGEIKFSEMTFTTDSGTCKWDPEEYDQIFGDYIKLPTDLT